MNLYKLMASALTAIILLAGCSNSSTASSAEHVTHKCTASFSGMDVTLDFKAPSDKDNVTEMFMTLKLPASFFGMTDLSAVTQDAMDNLKPSLAEQMEIPADNITMEIGKDAIDVTMKFDKDQMKKALHLEDSTDLHMETLLKELKKNDFAKCD
ncbi:MAG: hypothetical protein HUJ54_02155 [Erysipelotrichaceae bacterium]|nr:hypothetical protein [Erysipelotrichaceae bacterium]